MSCGPLTMRTSPSSTTITSQPGLESSWWPHGKNGSATLTSLEEPKLGQVPPQPCLPLHQALHPRRQSRLWGNRCPLRRPLQTNDHNQRTLAATRSQKPLQTFLGSPVVIKSEFEKSSFFLSSFSFFCLFIDHRPPCPRRHQRPGRRPHRHLPVHRHHHLALRCPVHGRVPPSTWGTHACRGTGRWCLGP